MATSSYNNVLASCVTSLQDSNRLLDSAITNLHNGVRDLPRTKTVLQCTRHFELISEPSLFAAQNALADEIGPEVEHLLGRVEQHLAKMERREKGLISKAALQEGRIQQNQPSVDVKSMARIRTSMFGIDPDAERAEKLKMLRSKKERLEHTVGRLGLQATHKERQLRMSMSYGNYTAK